MKSRDLILLSAEMTDQGYWLVTWSLRAGLRLPITCTKVGISRSGAIEAAKDVAGRQELPQEGAR